MPGRRRKRRSKAIKRQRLIKNLKIYSAIFVGCFAIAAGLSLATGKLPGMFNKAVYKAISPIIEDKVGSLGGGAAQSIINSVVNEGGSASRGGEKPPNIDKNQLKKLAEKYKGKF